MLFETKNEIQLVEPPKVIQKKFVEPTAAFYTNLLLYADFFCLQRLFEICESRLKNFINCENLMPIMLLAYHHNCPGLLQRAIHTFNCSKNEVLKSSHW
jgi:hypothetical protein